MKMFVAVLLSALTLPGHAQRLLDALEKNQSEISPKPNSASGSATEPQVKVEPVSKTKTAGECKEPDQTSIPLRYLTSLIQEKGGSIEVSHDPRSGKISITSPEMITNCSSMIEWTPNARVVDGRKIYSIEAKIKKADECDEAGCTYEIAKVEKGQFKQFEKVKVKPTLSGFEDCLEKSGVMTGGKLVKDAIYPGSVSEKFDGFKESGELLFVSHGPMSKMIKAKHDKFVEVDKCDHYEKVTAAGIYLKSAEDEESERLAAEKAEIAKCGEYDKISDFMERYQGYADDLNSIRDNLIIEAVKKASKNILSGKYSEEDLKALADFEKYIVQPKINLVNVLYAEAQGLEGPEKAARMTQIKAVMAQLASYMQKPMLTSQVVQKLEANGDFDGAAQTNGMRALIVSHARLGAKEGNVIITPAVAKERTDKLVAAYAKELAKKKEIYEVRTGQVTGKSKENLDKARRSQQYIQIRTQNFSQSIAEEYARIQQPNGYCYRSPFRNVQNCVQRSLAEIQRLQQEMIHFNQVDAKNGADYLQQAEMYSKLEKEGERYIARENGEDVGEEEDAHTSPTSNNQGYNFDFSNYTQQVQQQALQQSMQPQQGNMFQQNPYQQNPYQQNPYGQQNQMGNQMWGQFNFSAGNQYGYNNQQQGSFIQNPYGQQNQFGPYQTSMFGAQFQAQNPFMQQPNIMSPQQGYWQNPYQAQGQYNMWGK